MTFREAIFRLLQFHAPFRSPAYSKCMASGLTTCILETGLHS